MHHTVCVFLAYCPYSEFDFLCGFTMPGGRDVKRLEQPHPRCYQSIFGEFQLQRTVYGQREGQVIELVPLDARLQLPESEFS